MKNILKFLVLIIIVFGLSACKKTDFFSLPKEGDTGIIVSDAVQPGEVAIIDSNIIVTKPLSNDTISSPIEIKGRARVFEGTVLFRLKDGWDNVIASGFTTAIAGAPDWGFYSDELSFEKPSTPVGWFEVYTQSAKDGSDQNLIRMPIKFKEFQNQTVNLYFNNIEGDPDMLDCGNVYPVERGVEYPLELISAAIFGLTKGLTEEEINNGFVTNIPEGVEIQNLELKQGVIYVDFNQALQEGVAGSCQIEAIRAQITQTLKQFDEVEEVVISINGETEEILQP